MFEWLRPGRTKDTLKGRLELVLAYDRAKIPPGKVEALRNDLLEVVQRYFPSNYSQIEIAQDGENMVLTASLATKEPKPVAKTDAKPPLGREGRGKKQ